MSLRRDNELSASFQPTLATIDNRPEVMGNRAVQHLRWRVERIDESGCTRVRVEPALVEGVSVASLR
jgi:DNA-binding LacI/PurR family transcriptional regulator